MKTIKENLSFKAYYENLSKEDKLKIRHLMVPTYMHYPTFYYKVKKEEFTTLELEKLSFLTGINFTR